MHDSPDKDGYSPIICGLQPILCLIYKISSLFLRMIATSLLPQPAQQPPMEWRRLTIYFLIAFFVDSVLRDWLEADSLVEIAANFTNPHQLALQFTSLLTFAFYTALCYLMLHSFYASQPPWKIFGMLLLIGIGGILFRAFLEEGLLRQLTGRGNYNPKLSWGYYFRDNSIYVVTYCGLATVFYIVRYGSFQLKMRRQSQLQEREAELKFLRSQVNPHFLFNTLNNLYAMVNRGSEKALPTLEKLSGLLRYSLYEQQDLVPVAKEIEYLRDLIHLESLRIDAAAPIECSFGDFDSSHRLPPLLLLPFVENAFKHGDLKDPEHPLRITIEPLPQGGLDFKVANKINNSRVSKDKVGGIGVQNVRKRLALLYPNSHRLQIESTELTYTIQLSIDG